MAIPRMKNEKRSYIRGIAMPSVGNIGLKLQVVISSPPAMVLVKGYF